MTHELKRLDDAVRALLPHVRTMLPRHPTSNTQINLLKRLLADAERALAEHDRQKRGIEE